MNNQCSLIYYFYLTLFVYGPSLFPSSLVVPGGPMRANRSFPVLIVSSTVLLAIAFTLASVAATDAILPRSNLAQTSRPASAPAQANKTYMLYSGFWRTDGGFVSTIRIKNVLTVAP